MTPEEEQAFLDRKKAKRAGKRGFAEEGAVLGMTSLMDAITIIVTYLLKNYGPTRLIAPTAGQEGAELTADTPIQDGADLRRCSARSPLHGRRGADGRKRRGRPRCPAGPLDRPLYDLLAEEADRAKKMSEGKGEEVGRPHHLVGDQEPVLEQVDVMYTAGRAEFREYVLASPRRTSSLNSRHVEGAG
ncbi:MAG: hypothetical protein U0168_28695 [Nannocystaceae bacterium]